MSLGEGDKMGLYTSLNLKDLDYTSSLTPDTGVNLDPLECPDLYQIDLDGDFKGHTWILAAGAKGSTVYWFGKWDGKGFTATDAEPQLMDNGPDFYATVSWTNPKNADIYGSRYAIAWMNNWEYANSVPYYGDFAGQTSMVREVKLQTIKYTPTLASKPIVGYGGILAPPNADLTDDAYVICATISKTNDSSDGNEVRFRIKTDGSFSTTIGYNFNQSQAILVRNSDGSATESMPSDPKKAYDAVATAPNPSGSNTVKLEIYVDSNSVEVFVDDSVVVLSGLDYPNKAAEGVQDVSDTGSLTLVSFSYAAYKA
ncbi:hypothetical protein AbraIFM66950_003907 [Aspergillus brasiliensis]|nr:hypothetical protein AbraIFM66950_003907 [Aspergillus brasiliensis]